MAVPPLRAIVAAGFEVPLVVTRPDKRRGRGSATSPSPVKVAATELGLPVSHDLADVGTVGADLGVVVAYGRIIPAAVLDALPMVNLHFSLLPRWRGAAPVERAILAGDHVTGVCVMAVDETLDTGDVYRRREVPVSSQTVDELRRELVSVGAELLVEALRSGLRDPEPQVGEPTYAEKLGAEDRHLDWSRPAVELDRVVRIGGAWTTFRGRRLKVWRAEVVDEPAAPVPGALDGDAVMTGEGRLRLVEVQPEGKARQAAADWLRRRAPGRRRAAGAVIGAAGSREMAPVSERGTRSGAGGGPRRAADGQSPPSARALALEALVRIDRDGAFANLVMPGLLERSGLDSRDRAHATDLVYGATRMRRACDWSADRFVQRDLEPEVRAAIRLGAYQLLSGTPPHAAVSETVAVAPQRARGLVNAVLRRVADSPPVWPDEPTRLSYPDWIVERMIGDLGRDAAVAALERMNRPAAATERSDGYVQDRGSQLVVEAMAAAPGSVVVDLCAAPGGKATGLAADGSRVLALDLRPGRVGLIDANAARLDLSRSQLSVAVGDGLTPPVRPGSVDGVLVDAPCSGLGALRRRADARWRIVPEAVDRLASLQVHLLRAAAPLVGPGGTLVYSVCTLTATETVDVAGRFAAAHPEFEPVPIPGDPWSPGRDGTGALLLPQAADTDGMVLYRWRRRDGAGGPAV